MKQTFSTKINEKQKKNIVRYMHSHIKNNNNPNIEYFIKTKKYSISIFYNHTILIQGAEYNNILKIIDIKTEKERPQNLKEKISIGTDESGNGDLFGGISIAAVKIKEKENIEKLIKLGVNDSKKLNDNFMRKIYRQIINLTENEIINIDAMQYNEMYKKYKNINTIKTYGHNKVIKKIYKNKDIVLIDQYTNLNKFKEHMESLNEEISYKMYLETKAESKYLEVACASILARVNFLLQIEKIEKELKQKIPLGCNTSIVKPVLEKLKKNNLKIDNYIKTHFKTNKD